MFCVVRCQFSFLSETDRLVFTTVAVEIDDEYRYWAVRYSYWFLSDWDEAWVDFLVMVWC